MPGPDFHFGRVTEWRTSGGTGWLTLADASRWSIPSSAPLFASIQNMVELARRLDSPIFVSGDRRTGHLDDVELPKKLIPAFVAQEPFEGKLVVEFHGPPSPAFLRTDRPWFASARAQLVASIARETPREFPPPLLVTIAVVTREIMDVRAP